MPPPPSKSIYYIIYSRLKSEQKYTQLMKTRATTVISNAQYLNKILFTEIKLGLKLVKHFFIYIINMCKMQKMILKKI